MEGAGLDGLFQQDTYSTHLGLPPQHKVPFSGIHVMVQACLGVGMLGFGGLSIGNELAHERWFVRRFRSALPEALFDSPLKTRLTWTLKPSL